MRARGRGGFTLIETVLATALLGLLLLALTGLLAMGGRGVEGSRQRQTAIRIAQAELEKLRTVAFSELAARHMGQEAPHPDHPGFFYKVEVRDANPCPYRLDDGTCRLKEVRVTVRWSAGAGSREITLTTLRADR